MAAPRGSSQPPAEAGKEIEFYRKSAAGEKKSDAAGQVLGLLPPQVEVKAKFAEVSQDDRKAWGLIGIWGNSLAGNAAIQAPKGAMAPAQTGKSAGSAQFGIVSGDTQNLNYQWGYDASAASSLADSDAEKPPILGEVPLAGRSFEKHVRYRGEQCPGECRIVHRRPSEGRTQNLQPQTRRSADRGESEERGVRQQ